MVVGVPYVGQESRSVLPIRWARQIRSPLGWDCQHDIVGKADVTHESDEPNCMSGRPIWAAMLGWHFKQSGELGTTPSDGRFSLE